jgi:hypothetical protein
MISRQMSSPRTGASLLASLAPVAIFDEQP